MRKRFDPINDKSGEIIEFIMNAPEIPQDDSLQFKIRLSVEEVVENVVNYAYQDKAGWLEAITSLDDDSTILTIVIKDAGVPFNPLNAEDPDITLGAEEREIGGLGIFLCKQLMDKMDYKYQDGCNVLTMSKKLN